MKLRSLVPLLLGAAALAACGEGGGSPTGGNATPGLTPGAPSANLTGAIFTSDVTCSGTDENIYNSKDEVYANGGPQNPNAAGLPDGYYYVQVTSPDGQPLGTTVGSANERPAHVTGGSFDQCYHLMTILIRASNGMQGYDDTPNAGGEYKLWISSSRDFAENESKTDNFKVIPQAPPPVMPVVEVTKTATSYYERAWKWSVDKNGDTGTLTLAPGQTKSVSYSVVVVNTGTQDRAFKVSGNITVTNTGTVPATVNSMADVDDFGSADVVSCGTLPRTLAVGEAMSCSYAQAIGSPAFGTTYTNTATASVARPGGGEDLQFAGGAQFSFDAAAPNLRVDECVSVSDSWSGANLANAQVCANQSPATWTYSRSFGPGHITDCGKTVNADNTATVTGTEASASDSWRVAVSYVCGCTPGYWKNNTGGWPLATGTLEGSVFPPSLNAQFVLSGKLLGNYTFSQGLGFQGNSTTEGGAEILLRAASAAYLNANKFGYAWTAAQVTTAANAALASNDRAQMIALGTQLDALNNAGCPLNAKGAAINP